MIGIFIYTYIYSSKFSSFFVKHKIVLWGFSWSPSTESALLQPRCFTKQLSNAAQQIKGSYPAGTESESPGLAGCVFLYKHSRPLWCDSFWGPRASVSFFYSLRPPPEPPVPPWESRSSSVSCVGFNLFFCFCIWWTAIDRQLFISRGPAAFQM